MRRTYVHRNEHEMKRNAKIGLFTKPSLLVLSIISYESRADITKPFGIVDLTASTASDAVPHR